MSDKEVQEEWDDLSKDFHELESSNEHYLKKLNELTACQEKCAKQINHQKYRLNIIHKKLKGVQDAEKLIEMKNNIMKREAELNLIEQTLPKETSTYLKVVLGNINVSFLNNEQKFKYKDDYEKFKLILNVIAFIFAVVSLYFEIRAVELICLFLLCWYYCTLSIRESILKVNGSRIKGWWRFHHVLSTVASGVLLVWPESESWYSFRGQFMWYTIYNSVIQYLQFKYQRGALYRLKALGKRDNMDITIEGFHSWMWRGLTFLLPFLFIGYVFQLTNSITLYNLSLQENATWHVSVLSFLFFVFFIGNTTTTLMVVPIKFKERMKLHYRVMAQQVFSYVAETGSSKSGK